MNNGRFYQASLYVHIFSNGTVYLIRSAEKRGIEGTLSLLLDELKLLEDKRGILLYSMDSSASVATPKIQELLSVISKFRVETQMVEAHPEVHGYDRSFKPYLNETLEVAEIDVEGLKQHLAEARNNLKRGPRGTLEYQRQKKLVQILKNRLEQAQNYLSKISSLYLELCASNHESGSFWTPSNDCVDSVKK